MLSSISSTPTSSIQAGVIKLKKEQRARREARRAATCDYGYGHGYQAATAVPIAASPVGGGYAMEYSDHDGDYHAFWSVHHGHDLNSGQLSTGTTMVLGEARRARHGTRAGKDRGRAPMMSILTKSRVKTYRPSTIGETGSLVIRKPIRVAELCAWRSLWIPSLYRYWQLGLCFGVGAHGLYTFGGVT